MSDYCRVKALRVPVEKLNIPEAAEDFWEWYEAMEEKYPDRFSYRDAGKFSKAPTEEEFLDFVLEEEYGVCDSGDWGKVRDLYDSEAAMYYPIFKSVEESINMSDVRLVEFCWYNGTEAPDYYDITKDEFYKKIPYICNFEI